MKILFTHYKHDYTNQWKVTSRNYPSDYYLMYLPLVAFAEERGHELVPFWIDEVILAKGREGMRLALRDAILEGKPDICLFYSGNEEDYEAILPEIKRTSKALMVFYGLDDSWRFDIASRRVAPYFSQVVTYYGGAVAKYKALGCDRVFNTQAGVDTQAFSPVPGEKTIDVSFVGTFSEPRGKIVGDLRRAGIDILVRGNGWPEGPVSQDEMARIFSHSKISLSLNPPAFYFGWRPLVRLFLRRAYLGEDGAPYKLDILHFFANLRSWWQKKIPQIKGRHFEIAAFGTMEITQDADNLRDFYVLGKEIVTYADLKDLILKIHYYLEHADEREVIARAGRERTLRDHDAKKRMLEDFDKFGMPL